MYGTELIQKFFTPTANLDLTTKFYQGAGFFDNRNCIYKYECIDNDKIRIYFLDKFEFRDEAIIENGVKVGIVTLVHPHTRMTRSGTFICSGVKKIISNKKVGDYRRKDLNISKRFWSQNLNIKINNKHLNIRIKCKTIYPESFESETIKLTTE